jgi:hypothetical protein
MHNAHHPFPNTIPQYHTSHARSIRRSPLTAQAAQLDSTRRALTVATDELASARAALASTNRALAKAEDVSENRLRIIHKLKPERAEPGSIGAAARRLTSSHTVASAARSIRPSSSRLGGR